MHAMIACAVRGVLDRVLHAGSSSGRGMQGDRIAAGAADHAEELIVQSSLDPSLQLSTVAELQLTTATTLPVALPLASISSGSGGGGGVTAAGSIAGPVARSRL